MDQSGNVYVAENPPVEDVKRLKDAYREMTEAQREQLERQMRELDEDRAPRAIRGLRWYLSQP